MRRPGWGRAKRRGPTLIRKFFPIADCPELVFFESLLAGRRCGGDLAKCLRGQVADGRDENRVDKELIWPSGRSSAARYNEAARRERPPLAPTIRAAAPRAGKSFDWTQN